jgi:hypothetical protein
MSRQTTNNKEKRIQFVLKKENPEFEILKNIEKIYSCKKTSSNIKKAITDLNILYQFFGVDNISNLLLEIQNHIDN